MPSMINLPAYWNLCKPEEALVSALPATVSVAGNADICMQIIRLSYKYNSQMNKGNYLTQKMLINMVGDIQSVLGGQEGITAKK